MNDYLVLVYAPIEQVGQAFIQMGLVTIWKRDVYAREIKLTNKRSFILFQFHKHPWTIIQSSYFFPHTILFQDEYALLISSCLHTKAIYYQVSDVGGFIGYHLYDCGQSLERLYYPKDVDEAIDDGINEDQIADKCDFQSRLRQLKADDIQDAYDFTDNFLREQDAYAPGISWPERFPVGNKVTVLVTGLERHNFERMDYMALY